MTEARDKDSDHEDQPNKNSENLRNVYDETCARHRAIDDFRGKLLALLPIASGAAGLLLLSKSDSVLTYLPVIGIYGCAVTAGLFVYELRGVHECGDVMRQAGKLEEELGVPFDMGQFRDEGSRPLGGLVGAEMASWVVYFSVFGGWLYLAGRSGWWNHVSPAVIVLVAAVALLVKSAFVVGEEIERRKKIEKRKQAEQKARAKKEEPKDPLPDGAGEPGGRRPASRSVWG